MHTMSPNTQFSLLILLLLERNSNLSRRRKRQEIENRNVWKAKDDMITQTNDTKGNISQHYHKKKQQKQEK